MVYYVGWNIECIHINIYDVLSVVYIIYSVAHNIYHKQYRIIWGN